VEAASTDVPEASDCDGPGEARQPQWHAQVCTSGHVLCIYSFSMVFYIRNSYLDSCNKIQEALFNVGLHDNLITAHLSYFPTSVKQRDIKSIQSI